jgi:hypothetical protein
MRDLSKTRLALNETIEAELRVYEPDAAQRAGFLRISPQDLRMKVPAGRPDAAILKSWPTQNISPC